MSKSDQGLTKAQLLEENHRLRARLEKADQTLQTIRSRKAKSSARPVQNPHKTPTQKAREAGNADSTNMLEQEQIKQALRESAERFKVIAACTPDHILIQDRELRYTFVINPQLNLTEKDMIGKTDYDILAKEDADKITAIKRRVLETGEPAQLETPVADANSQLQYFEGSYIPTFDEKKRVTGLIGYFRNVTDHKRVELALRQGEARYRSLVEVSPDAIFVNRGNRIVLVNQAALELFGATTADQILGKTPFDLFHPDYHAQIGERIQKMLAGGTVPVAEEKIVRLDGTQRLVEVAAVNCVDAEGSAIQVILHDITERQAREKELQSLNRTLKALSNINQAMMRSMDETDLMNEVCRIVVKDCGHAMVWIGLAEQDELKTVRPVAYAGFEEGYLETLKITWSDSERGRGPTGMAIRTGKVSMCRNMLTDPRFKPWLQEALKRGYASSIVLPLLSDDKAFGAITIYSREPDPFSENEVALLSELANDLAYGITTLRTRLAHAQAEEALQESEARYRSLFDSMTEGFAVHEIICDEQGKPCDYRFLDVNPAFEALTGLKKETVVGKNHNQVLLNDSPRWVEEYGAVAITGKPSHFENYSPALQQHYEVFAYRPMPNQFAVLFMNITERKRMENELQKARAKAEEHANELDVVFNSITDGIVVFDPEGHVKRTNRAALEMLGFDPCSDHFADLAKTMPMCTMGGTLLDPALAPSARALRGETVVGEHYFFQNHHGQNTIAIASASPLWNGNHIAGTVAVWKNVTEQHKAEETRAWLASFPELNPNPIVESDETGKIYYLNPSARRLFPDLEAKGNVHPWLNGLKPILENLRQGKEPTTQREVQVGETYYLQTLSYVTQSGRIRIYGFDITSRKQAEEALRQSRDVLDLRVHERTHELSLANQQLQVEQHRFNDVLEMLPAYLILLNPDYQATFANRFFRERFGEANGRPCYEFLFGRSQPCEVCETYKVLKTGQPLEWEWTGPDNHNYAVYDFPFTDVDGASLILEMGVDITERKQAEEALRLANAYNRSLLEASLDPLATITPDGKIGDVNTATEKVTGLARQELIGTDFHAYFSTPEKARAGYQKVFEDGSVRDYELEIRHKDGHVTPVLYNASVYRDQAGHTKGVFAVARDITDRKQFEAQLMQAEKYAIIGRMVGSVTHEINNPLQTIKNCLYLIQQDTTSESSFQEPLEMAMSETARLTNLVGQLRELYRPRTDLQEHPQELLDILEEVHALLTPHLNNSKIQWKPLTGLTRCYINCVRDQILEVFLNISMNAIEAMHSTAGTLFVNMSLEGDQVGVVFRDSGPGISPEILPHIFEPFMTTKSSGLGLGLSISYGIIQRHGGQIKAENCPDGGASFTIWLPVARKSWEEKAKHGT